MKNRIAARRPRAGWCGALMLLLASLFGPPPGAAQGVPDATILGRVTEEAGAPVAEVLLELLPAGEGAPRRSTITAADGNYRLGGIAPGAYRLRVERLGFEPRTVELELVPGEVRRIDLALVVAPVRIDPLVAENALNARRERARFEGEAGTTARVINSAQLKALPGLAEADVLRAVEVLPGVVTTSDFSSAFNVRGGSADQNLILLDGFPIFNPFHLGGLFSVFNADVLARAELLAGGFGAEHGGRVSSVLNVETRDYVGEKFGGEAGVSLLATRLSLHGALPAPGSLDGGWFLSARRSYFDKVLPPDMGLPYHLADLQGALSLALPGGGQVRLVAYTGDDVLDMSKSEPKRRKADSGEERGMELLRVNWSWGNDVAGVRWDQPWGEWVTTARVGLTRFDERFGMVDFDGPNYRSRLEQLFARGELGRDFSPALSLRLGAEGSRLRSHNTVEGSGSTLWAEGGRGTLGSAFAQLGWRPTAAWILEPGVRLDAWAADSASLALVSPRLAAKRFLGAKRDAALKLAVGRYTQFLHSLKDEMLPIGNDTWVLTGRYLPAVTSDQVQIGVEKYWGERWSASAESYLRRFRGLVMLNPANDLNDPSDHYLNGEGRSYGADLLVRKSAGRWTGWTTISLLKAERTFPDPLMLGWEDVPPTITYAPAFDRRLDIDLVLQVALPSALEFGLRWNYGSPLPYTRPVAQHVGWQYDPVTGRYRIPPDATDWDLHAPPKYVLLGPRNGERYPAYHRADLSLRRTFRPGWGTVTPYVQVLNVYNHKNPLFYFYDYASRPATVSGVTMFPILPTIGLEMTF